MGNKIGIKIFICSPLLRDSYAGETYVVGQKKNRDNLFINFFEYKINNIRLLKYGK